PHETSEHGVVTVSIGVAAAEPGRPVRPHELIEAADAALYEAKRGGRDRAVAAAELPVVGAGAP
ncbi:diguanylate cyclase domain-containing protein, partial [Paenibacillus sp.]|uniref:diguanylate cyclase domain-containing protein n=1 Tax=Paenibacillus sp. TaxID=58172 RepID=UPI002D4102D5